MSLFRLTVKRRIVGFGTTNNRLEVGMSINVTTRAYCSQLPWTPEVVETIKQQFQVQYGVDITKVPSGLTRAPYDVTLISK